MVANKTNFYHSKDLGLQVKPLKLAIPMVSCLAHLDYYI